MVVIVAPGVMLATAVDVELAVGESVAADVGVEDGRVVEVGDGVEVVVFVGDGVVVEVGDGVEVVVVVGDGVDVSVGVSLGRRAPFIVDFAPVVRVAAIACVLLNNVRTPASESSNNPIASTPVRALVGVSLAREVFVER